jgi:hypothetical protein
MFQHLLPAVATEQIADRRREADARRRARAFGPAQRRGGQPGRTGLTRLTGRLGRSGHTGPAVAAEGARVICIHGAADEGARELTGASKQ